MKTTDDTDSGGKDREAGFGESVGSLDYYEVVRQRPNKKYSFLCNVLARNPTHALKIARSKGHKLSRGSYAARIGKSGYYDALRRVFPANVEITNPKKGNNI